MLSFDLVFLYFCLYLLFQKAKQRTLLKICLTQLKGQFFVTKHCGLQTLESWVGIWKDPNQPSGLALCYQTLLYLQECSFCSKFCIHFAVNSADKERPASTWSSLVSSCFCCPRYYCFSECNKTAFLKYDSDFLPDLITLSPNQYN